MGDACFGARLRLIKRSYDLLRVWSYATSYADRFVDEWKFEGLRAYGRGEFSEQLASRLSLIVIILVFARTYEAMTAIELSFCASNFSKAGLMRRT